MHVSTVGAHYLNSSFPEKIILFDGVCIFCNRFVVYIINHDPKGKFKFASLQSTIGIDILAGKSELSDFQNSMVYISSG
jgi:predicted DCC family thiol-disulfide oxidoreductase YuxK